MHGWILLLCVGILLQIANLILRRFKLGRQIIRVSGYLSSLFLIGVVTDFIGIGERLRIPITGEISLNFHWFALLVFMSYPIYTLFQSITQAVGDWYIKQTHKDKMPTQGNYKQKGAYILPFRGKWTVFNGGVDENLRHGGSASQTYAYDFIIMDDAGKSFDGSPTDLHSYYCYEKNIIAPADGVVVKVRKKAKNSYVDGINAYCDSVDIRGNFVTIKHHDNEYSVSAHLLPNSITVKVGDKVKQGDVIGKCGNTGNTSEPHLHFQFQSGKSFFFSVGLPIAFSGINTQDKMNYELADPRPNENNLQVMGDKVYIGRGLEVWNNDDATAMPKVIALLQERVSEKNLHFTRKPILIGGMAKEYYGLRESGADIDLVVCDEDYQALALAYPDDRVDAWGDLGIRLLPFEIWRSIKLLDYDFYVMDAIDEKIAYVVSLEKLCLMCVFAMDVPKYMDDLKIIKDYYFKAVHNPEYRKFQDKHFAQYVSDDGVVLGGEYTNG